MAESNNQFMVMAVVLFTAITCLSGVSQEKKDIPTLAVFDFKIGQSITKKKKLYSSNYGRTQKETTVSLKSSLLTNKLITKFTKTNRVSVVERKRMNQLLKESELSQTDFTSQEHAVKMGKILGADHMLFGSISMVDGREATETVPFTDRRRKTITFIVGADIRIIETETGEVVAAESLQAENKKEISGDNTDFLMAEFKNEAYEKLVDKIASRTMSTLFPIKVAQFAGGIAYLNRGNLETGTVYEVVKLGEPIKDPTTGKVLGRTETKVARIKITEGLNKMSKAKVTEWIGEKKSIPTGSICREVESGKKKSGK